MSSVREAGAHSVHDIRYERDGVHSLSNRSLRVTRNPFFRGFLLCLSQLSIMVVPWLCSIYKLSLISRLFLYFSLPYGLCSQWRLGNLSKQFGLSYIQYFSRFRAEVTPNFWRNALGRGPSYSCRCQCLCRMFLRNITGALPLSGET